MDPNIRNGYDNIHISIKVKGDVPEETLRELVQIAQDRSPVYDIVKNPVNIIVNIEK